MTAKCAASAKLSSWDRMSQGSRYTTFYQRSWAIYSNLDFELSSASKALIENTVRHIDFEKALAECEDYRYSYEQSISLLWPSANGQQPANSNPTLWSLSSGFRTRVQLLITGRSWVQILPPQPLKTVAYGGCFSFILAGFEPPNQSTGVPAKTQFLWGEKRILPPQPLGKPRHLRMARLFSHVFTFSM